MVSSRVSYHARYLSGASSQRYRRPLTKPGKPTTWGMCSRLYQSLNSSSRCGGTSSHTVMRPAAVLTTALPCSLSVLYDRGTARGVAVHEPAQGQMLIEVRLMLSRHVVPHEEVARLPVVLVLELRLD